MRMNRIKLSTLNMCTISIYIGKIVTDVAKIHQLQLKLIKYKDNATQDKSKLQYISFVICLSVLL